MAEVTPSPPPRRFVYVVEDDAAVRESLALLLGLQGFEVATFDCAEHLPAAEALRRPACALIDVRLPGASGLDLQRKLLADRSDLPVIIMTAHGDAATARRALREGAVDFLEKPLDESDLMEAVEAALESDVLRLARNKSLESARQSLQRLSEREREVFQRITNGQHNREIAEDLGISPRTVEVHRARVMEKLQARRVADLFRLRFELDGD
jgi:two-component system response regulator FixJ